MNAALDERWMLRALELAERGRGFVEPNPLVGAVVVRNHQIVGEGWHECFGGPHAEVVALDRAGGLADGADLFVTLEPCCHHGKTPPCTERVIRSRVRRVVAAMLDPFPEVAGRGADQLRAAGIEVSVGLLENESRRLNAPYLMLLREGRPFIHAKWAMTVDGKIATRTRESKWITGEAARAHGLCFRGLVDAIVVGIETCRADDPLLTARPHGPRTPTRVVLDSHARLSIESRLVATARPHPTLVVTTRHAPIDRVETLKTCGCEVIDVSPTTLQSDSPRADNPTLARVNLIRLACEFGRRRWSNVLIEGGPTVLGSFFDAGLVDAARVYIAPRIVGGVAAPGPVGGAGIGRLAEAIGWEVREICNFGGDVFLSLAKPISSATE